MNTIKETDYAKLAKNETAENIVSPADGPLANFLDNLEESFFSLDLVKMKVIYATKGCMKIFGYPPEAFLADPELWFKIMHPDDREWVKKMQSLLPQGQIQKMEYKTVHPDGTTKWVLSKVIPKLDKEGNLIRLDGYTFDIDDRKKAELKLEKYNTLMYQISHDLRGPLNSAKNYIAIALNKVKGEPAHTYFEKIEDSYNKLEAHVMSLLDLSRLNRTGIITEKIEIAPFIRNMISYGEDIQGFEKVKITTEVNVPFDLYSDRQFMQSILSNIIRNAIKFRRNIPDSFIHISAHADKDKVEIKIADNGIGIPEAMQANVFKMFAKGTKGETGNGLGLYIVRKLVQKLKGTVSLESEEGKGTTFRIRIPSYPS
jgi:PAS domain S-box-containing protein